MFKTGVRTLFSEQLLPADEGDPVSLNQGINSSSKVSEKWGQPKRLQGLTIIENRVEEKAMD